MKASGAMRFAYCTLRFSVLNFAFSSPVHRLDQPQAGGGLGDNTPRSGLLRRRLTFRLCRSQHCSSPAVGRGVCAPPGRVAQTRLFAAGRGNPAGVVNRGGVSWITFFGRTKKVIGVRGHTPRSCFSFMLPTMERTEKIKPALIALLLASLAILTTDALARRTGGVRDEAIDMVVIHSTGGPTCDAATGKPIWVGAGTLEENIRQIEAHPILGIHYMIDRDGTLRTSVPEEQLAHHVLHYSHRSISIELINDGDGRDPFPAAQLDSLVKLLRDITQRRGITRDNIKRHSDIDHGKMDCDATQRRKVDPGAAFPFKSILKRVFPPQKKSAGA